jgi:hypothetical protein
VKVYSTLTFHRHKTPIANCSIAKHKSRVIITNMNNTTTNNRKFKECPRITIGLYCGL